MIMLPIRSAIIGLAILALPALAHAQASPSPYTSGTRYDVLGRVTGTIAPDPEGASPWQFLAVRNSYDNWGRLTKVETGSLSVWKSEAVAPASWGADFTVQSTVDRTYDNLGHKLSETVKGSDGVTVSLTQFSYLSTGELECTAVRMNPAVFGSPPASACTLGTEGSNGPDRITRNEYVPAEPGLIKKIQKGYGTPLQQDYASYTYSSSLKVVTMTDARGFVARMTYDGHDRQARWYFPDKVLAATPSTTDYEEYGYDANSNRTSFRKRDGSTLTYSYDALNRMTLKVVPSRADLSAAQTADVFYDYDLRGLMTKARFDSLSGDGLTSGYSGFGELTSSTIAMAGFSKTLSHAYDKNSKRTELTHADAQKFTYKRDQLGRVTNLYEGTSQTGTNQLIQAVYDNRGLVDTVQRSTSGNAFLADFTFDPAGRLSSLAQDATGTANDLTVTQTFNVAGQIASQTRSNDSYSWTGAAAINRNYAVNGINQYSAVAGTGHTYDANGNLTSDGSTTFLYDIENRLVSASGAKTASLTYDPMGRLWQVTGTSTNTRFLYDGDELVAEYDSSGTMARRYAHSDNVDDPVVQYDSATVGSAARKFLMPDERGSIAGLIANDGSSIAKNTYDEYGIPGAVNQGRFQYTGQIWIAELGLYHYKARLYSPALGRFLQVDPVGYQDYINLYLYVGNDPISRLDPTGERDIYIGGAFDKDSTRIVQDYAARIQKEHPDRDVRYFSHVQDSDIKSAIESPRTAGEPLNVIGHSMGGSEAIRQAADTDIKITNLVTIDPVGGTGDVGTLPNVTAWANVNSNPTSYDFSDFVADTGNTIWPDSDVSGAGISLNSNLSHGNFGGMMDQINAPQAIDRSYKVFPCQRSTNNPC